MSKLLTIPVMLIFLLGITLQGAGALPVSADDNLVSLPVIMYHEVKLNKPGKDAIQPWEFENDLKYLKAHHYTTVTVGDLENYVFNGVPLPEKPVLLSFDDGYLNNYIYAYPLLKKYDMKIVLSILVKNTDDFTKDPANDLDYAHVSWTQLNEMLKTGYVEVQNHTYNMHKITKTRFGCNQARNESFEKYRRLFEDDLERAQSRIFEMTGKIPTAFAYPYGRYNAKTDQILKEHGFTATLTCDYGINKITKDPECLLHLKRICRAHNQGIGKLINEAMKTLTVPIRNSAASGFQDSENGVIVLDAGHGGVDGGTSRGSLLEKDVNLKTALMCRSLLEQRGYKVILTRETDISLDHLNNSSRSRHTRDLNARARLINASNAQLFVSLHVNSNPGDPSENGSSVFYRNKLPQSRELALCIQDELNARAAANGRKTHRPQVGKYFILGYTDIPGVLVETGFITNTRDRELLTSEKFLSEIAAAVADGAERYLSKAGPVQDAARTGPCTYLTSLPLPSERMTCSISSADARSMSPSTVCL